MIDQQTNWNEEVGNGVNSLYRIEMDLDDLRLEVSKELNNLLDWRDLAFAACPADGWTVFYPFWKSNKDGLIDLSRWLIDFES